MKGALSCPTLCNPTDYTVHVILQARILEWVAFPFSRYLAVMYTWLMGFPGSSVVKKSACNAGDPGSIPELDRYPGGGHGKPLQYSCLENPMDRGGWQAIGLQRVGHNEATKQQQHASVTP